MDKKIVLEMQESKDILISIEGGSTVTISKQDRSIKANDIYKLLDFSRGDKFIVESKNEKNIDGPVLTFFAELFSDIVGKLDQFADYDEDEFLNETHAD